MPSRLRNCEPAKIRPVAPISSGISVASMCNWVLDVNFPLFVKLDPEIHPLEVMEDLAILKLATPEIKKSAAIVNSFIIEAE